MGLVQRVRDAFSGNSRQTVSQEIINNLRVDALCSSYENLFPQVQAYIDEMDVVFPFGVGRNGARLAESRTPELTLLRTPNEDMDWYSFIDSCFATWLTESELNIHVWKNRRGRVYGYSILPPNCREVRHDGDTVFHVYSSNNGQVDLTRDEVMTLRFSRSPRNIDKGISPAGSVETYAQLDDLMAQLQKARFENGAFPDTITTIRARTREQYEKTRAKMERGFTGARNKGKTLFIWRQRLDNGETSDEVEVKPISTSNTSLALGELNKIITDRLNKAFRVSEFILGNDSSAKYDNAELSQARFVEKCIYPALKRFWGQFQHELDRVVGGLGYAISFDLEVPELTDRAKTRAEILEIRTRTLSSMIAAGAMPSASVKALGLGKEWLPVADGFKYQTLRTDTSTDSKQTRSCACDHKQGTKQICAHSVRSVSRDAYMPIWGEDDVDEKKIYDLLMGLAAKIAAETNLDVEAVKEAINSLLLDKANEGANKGALTIEGLIKGTDVAEEIAVQLENDGYHLGEDFQKALAERTALLVDNFEEHTRAIVEGTLAAGAESGKSASEIRKELSEVLPRARAEAIARNETVYAFKSGRLENDRYLASQYGLKMKLVWRTSRDSDVCPACAVMEGVETDLGTAFTDSVQITPELESQLKKQYGNDWIDRNNVRAGETVAWEHSKWNDNGRTPNAHVNCRCYFDEVIE